MLNKYSLESVYEIWNDQLGTHLRVGPDADGVGLIDIKYVNESGQTVPSDRLKITLDEAKLLITALQKVVAQETENDRLLHLDAIDYLERGGTIRLASHDERIYRYDPQSKTFFERRDDEWNDLCCGGCTAEMHFKNLRSGRWPLETQWEIVTEE